MLTFVGLHHLTLPIAHVMGPLPSPPMAERTSYGAAHYPCPPPGAEGFGVRWGMLAGEGEGRR